MNKRSQADSSGTATPSTRRRVLVVLGALLLLGLMGMMLPGGPDLSTARAARWHQPWAEGHVVLPAAGRGNPWINLEDGTVLPTTYDGPAALRQFLEDGRAQPRVLAAGDFDQDGVPDLVGGFAGPAQGLLTLHPGNVDVLFPHSPQAQQRRAAGTFVEAPFLSPASIWALPLAPDFLGVGDFDNDGHLDVVVAGPRDAALYLLSGDGQGGLGTAVAIPLSSRVTALIAADVNRRDGLVDLVVAVDGPAGPQLLVFEGLDGALRAEPEIIPLPAAATALAVGQLDERYAMDIAAACGSTLVLVQGRDRTPLPPPQAGGDAEAGQPTLTAHPLAYTIATLALGDFIPEHAYRLELALLSADGVVHFVDPATATEITSYALPLGSLTLQPPASNLQLLPINVSSLPGADLAVLDPARQQVHIVVPVERQDTAGDDQLPTVVVRPWSVALDAAGAPDAVLSMRLNADALDDLVVLVSGAAGPVVLPTAPMATFVVDTLGDASDECAVGDGICAMTELQGDPAECVVVGGCTLRAAVAEADAHTGMDYIDFGLPGAGPHTIQLADYLWAMDPVRIDGTTQPAYAGTPIVEIRGSPDVNLYTSGGDTVIRGLLLNGAASHGLQLDDFFGVGAAHTIVEGNYFGVDATGQACASNGAVGIAIGDTSDNRIGGTTEAARNVISCNGAHGIQIATTAAATLNEIVNNLIGTDKTGLNGLGNGGSGVAIVNGPNNDVGGTTAEEGNLIADNWNGVGAGVIIAYADAAGNVVAGNGIGVNKDGGPLGNWSDGVAVVLDAHHNNIGGTAGVAPNGPCQGACNLIAANVRHGIHMGPFAVQELSAPPQADGRPAPIGVFLHPAPDGTPAAPTAVTGNLVRGNFIGTEEWGTSAQGNWGHGISLEGASGNTIGGPTETERNLLSGNDGSGVVLSGSGATGNKVQGNRIGTDAAGTANLGNALEGVSIEAGASDNTIGGTTTTVGNLIAFSGRNGVQVLDGVGNAILGNSIHSSGLLGIDLGGDGITPNDPDDSDNGPNNRQNFPLFTNIVPHGTTQIDATGILSSTPGVRFRLEFFAHTGYKTGGGVEGKDLLGSTEVVVGGNGRGNFSVTLPDQGDVLTANATRLDGNGQPVETSEFTPVDAAIVGVEVTQAIQNLGNSVELVNKKPTFALVHARALGPFQLADIRAQLTGWRDGVPVGTITAQPETVTLRRVPRRSFYDYSFHFQLPYEWTTGTVLQVEAEINYAPRTLAEADYANNKKTALVQFSPERWLRVRLYRVAWYSVPSGTWQTAQERTATGIERTLNAIYPTPHVYTERYKLTRYGLSPIDVIARLQINDELTSVRAWDRLWGAVEADVVYLGIIPEVSGGLASPLVYVASVGEEGSDEWVWKNAAHEIGHVFGRAHTCTPGGGESWCDGSYPYPDGEISPRPSGGPLSEYASTIDYGYDRMAGNPIHTNTTSDLMSYGIPTRWISDYTWNGIRAFVSRAEAPAAPPLQPPGEYLVFSGRISLTQEAVLLYPFYRVSDLPAQPLPISGTCTLRLLDAGGGELAAYSFAAPANPHIEPGEEPVASFAAVVPYVSGTVRIEVLTGTQVLATRLVSSATPTVTWVYPQGGEQLTGTVAISWTAADADADPFTATLFYSADDGGTWSVQSIGWPSTTFPLDTLALPGSDQARLRVLVSDGVNTGQATTDAFTVADKPPHPTITLPLPDQVYAAGEPVNLIGSAWDPEDGPLTGTALLWTDSVSGTLGYGEELLIPALAPGRHTLTLTATDGDGMTGTVSVPICYDCKVSLPLVIRNWQTPYTLTLEAVGQAAGPIYAVETQGQYAYLAEGATLTILDISDPAHPWRVGSAFLPYQANDVAVAGSYAYVTVNSSAGLRVLDVSDPAHPFEVGFYELYGYSLDVEVVGNYAYVINAAPYGWRGLQVLDVTDPANPTWMGAASTSLYAWNLHVVGDYAYTSAASEGLQVISVADPANPYLVGSYAATRADDVHVVGDYAYTAAGADGLQVSSVADPANPTWVGSYPSSWANGVYAAGGYAYLADDTGLLVLSVADPAHPALVGSTGDNWEAGDVYVSGSYAYVTSGGSLRVISLADPAHPAWVGTRWALAAMENVQVAGDYAYVADGGHGLAIISLADPTNPNLVGLFSTPLDARHVHAAGSYAYVVDNEQVGPFDVVGKVWIVDVSNPANPTQAGLYETDGGFVLSVFVVGDYAYVVRWDSLRVVSVADPAHPVEVGSLGGLSSPQQVYVAGSYAYLADGNSGLRILSLADPAHPVLVGTHVTQDTAWDVHVQGDYAYVAADTFGGLEVVQVTDPAHPVYVGSYDTPGQAQGVSVSGNFAYVADGIAGLAAIAVADPAHPTLIDTLDVGGGTDVYATGEYAYIYLVDPINGLLILRLAVE